MTARKVRKDSTAAAPVQAPTPPSAAAAPAGRGPDDRVGDVCSAILQGLVTRLEGRAREARAGSRDPKAVHQLRTSSRRLESVMMLFDEILDSRRGAARLRWLGTIVEATGTLRDLDVLAADLRACNAELSRPGGLNGILRLLADRRREDRAALAAFLASDDFRDGLKRMRADARAGSDLFRGRRSLRRVRYAIPARLYSLLAAARETAPEPAEADAAKLHELRLAAKLLRYGLECFQGVLGPEGEGLVGDVRAVQDHLGQIEDAEHAIAIMAGILESRDPRRTRRDEPAACQAWLKALVRRRDEGMNTWTTAWARVEGAEFRGRFGAALAHL